HLRRLGVLHVRVPVPRHQGSAARGARPEKDRRMWMNVYPATMAWRRSRILPGGSIEPAGVHCPGRGSMWFFVIGDLWIFTCYFACYIHDRAGNHELFLQAQERLSQGIGVLNTVVLLTSSLFVALCVQATRAGDIAAASRFLGLGFACGAGFMLIK